MKLITIEKEDNHTVCNILGIKLKIKNRTCNQSIEQIKPIYPLKTTTCKICGNKSNLVFKSKVLHNKYEAEYYFCPNCGFLQIDNPTWLDEAYQTPVTKEDTGILMRNQLHQNVVSIILYSLFKDKGRYLDYGGGWGFFTRMMRDNGFDYYHYDKFCENITAQGFEGSLNDKYSAITSFEAFEHFINPLKELENMLKLTDVIIFSQSLLPFPIPAPNDWWYYCKNHGQHISFYSKETFECIAKKYNLYYYSVFGLHLFSKINFDDKIKKMEKDNLKKLNSELKKNLKSKTMDDMYYIINTEDK